jgi:hypothetical protein
MSRDLATACMCGIADAVSGMTCSLQRTVAESALVSCLSLDADLETFKVGRNIVTS